MEKIRYYIYIPITIIVVYITWIAITNNNYPFDFGYINFSKDDVSNYSSLLGTLVGLFGVVLLVETLWLQFRQFKSDEKQKEKDVNLDLFYKLSLLNIDLNNIIKDIDKKAKSIKDYYEAELEEPFYTHILFRTPSNNYMRVLELDRLSLYKAFKKFLFYREDWLKLFNNLYSLLDFLPEFFKDIYDKYDNHYKDIFNQKMEIRNRLIELMNLGSKLLTDYKTERDNNYLNYPASSSVNEMIARYYEIISESQDDDGNIFKETDMQKISDYVLKHFITNFLLQRDDPQIFDRRLEPIAEIAQELRKRIFLVKSRNEEFAKNIKSQYETLLVDIEGNKSIKKSIIDINNIIEEGLKKINTYNL